MDRMSFDSLKFSTWISNLDQVEKFSEWILDFYTFESSRRKHSQLHFCECACVRLSRSYSRVIRTISVCHEITIAQCHIIATSHVCVCVCVRIDLLFLMKSLATGFPHKPHPTPPNHQPNVITIPCILLCVCYVCSVRLIWACCRSKSPKW